MRVIARERASSKSYDLIKLAAEKGFVIVCPNKEWANNIWKMASAMNVTIKKPISINEINSIAMSSEILIDGAEGVLETLLRNPIAGITVTKVEDEFDKLKRAAQPLVDYLRVNYDSHTSILVENDFVTVRRDEMGIPYACS